MIRKFTDFVEVHAFGVCTKLGDKLRPLMERLNRAEEGEQNQERGWNIASWTLHQKLTHGIQIV